MLFTCMDLLTTVLLFWELKVGCYLEVSRRNQQHCAPGAIQFVIPLPHVAQGATAEDAAHDGGEGNFELLVGHHVDDRVESRVKIAWK